MQKSIKDCRIWSAWTVQPRVLHIKIKHLSLRHMAVTNEVKLSKQHADQDKSVQLSITEKIRVPPISGAQRLLNWIHYIARLGRQNFYLDQTFSIKMYQNVTFWLRCLQQGIKTTEVNKSPKPYCGQPQVGQLGTSTEPSSRGWSTWEGRKLEETCGVAANVASDFSLRPQWKLIWQARLKS